MGPFRIVLAKTLQKLDFNSLPEQEKNILFNGIAYDAARHSIYRINILVEEITAKTFSNKMRRRQSYDKADRALIQVTSASDLTFLGIYPADLAAGGVSNPRVEAESLLELSATGPKLQLKGKYSQDIRKNKYVILASRSDTKAQWVFSKAYLETHSGFELDILCLAPQTTTPLADSLWCYVRFDDNGREIKSLKKRIYAESVK